MQTIKIEIEDDIFEDLKDSGINIQKKVKEFLYSLNDDGYPSIGTKEAKRRVKEAVERYRRGELDTVSNEEMWNIIDNECEKKLQNRV